MLKKCKNVKICIRLHLISSQIKTRFVFKAEGERHLKKDFG